MFTIKKGEKSKKHIIEQSAMLMNQHGFLATPLSEIVEATGMQKGGIYNHFKDKEELALLAFDQCCSVIQQYIEDALHLKTSGTDRIIAFIEVYSTFGENPTIPGGCPIMNASIEADDGQSAKLLERAQSAMQHLIHFLKDEITGGIANKELRPDIDPQKTATLIMSTIEGGILLNKLFNDRFHITTVQNHLKDYIKNELSIN
ncbi:TetR/AcrR family transcriptional regulator [Paenibacillus sepulcri]|uniref:TetR/AcrR family transcriptional regulator n=1 Tax=Paenibacillus sepulcri TaxID=359917 RepID=A0ABS7C2L2_9BACL|nr:TetR/AcrR family transcriptional regulator [Paenibacillus sepulcri]